MNKVTAVFRRDLRRILRNPIALIVALGVCVIPCLYAWINIAANWDPYENTSDIAVAVVNEDQPVEIGSMGAICAGDMIIEALRDNDQIGWTFVERDEALEGVRAGRYYAAIVLPQDFTAELAAVLDGNTDKAHFDYYVNEKANAIAPKVTDTGASTIETQIGNRFVGVVSKVIVERFQDFSDRVLDSADEVGDGTASTLVRVRTTLQDVNDQLESLSAQLGEAQTALLGAQTSIEGLSGTGSRISSSLSDVLNHVSDTRSEANGLVSRLSEALGSGMGTIAQVSSTTASDLSALAGDVAFAQATLSSAIGTLESDLTDTEALISTLEEASSLVEHITITPAEEEGEGESDAERLEVLRLEVQRQIDVQLAILVQISDEQAARLEELRGVAERLDEAAESVRALVQDVDAKVQASSQTLSDVQVGLIATTLAQVSNALDAFVQVAGQLSAAAGALDPLVTQTAQMAGQLAGVLGGAQGALGGTQYSLSSTADALAGIEADLGSLRSSQVWDLLSDALGIDAEGVQSFMQTPVEVVEEKVFPVANYASGVAPFFTSLALWVGGIALVAIFKLEVDEDEVGPLRPWQAYFGRWLLFVALGALQAIICCTGDLLIGIQCSHVWAFYLSAVVASFAFVNIIFALSVAFRHIGKALAFTLIILQVPGSSGTYPIEMMPDFFQAICPWLPFTYSNNAMREAIAGFYDSYLLRNLLMLLVFVGPALLVGVTFRSWLVNVNALFEHRLRETDHLMVCERVSEEQQHWRLSTVVKAQRTPQEYQHAIALRSAHFEELYPTLVARGILLLVTVPLTLFVLMLLLEAKLPLLACWVVSLVVIMTYLILVEYFHERAQRKRALGTLSPEELDDLVNEALREELLAFAPIDTLLELRRQRPHLPLSRHGAWGRHSIGARPKDDADARGGDAQ